MVEQYDGRTVWKTTNAIWRRRRRRERKWGRYRRKTRENSYCWYSDIVPRRSRVAAAASDPSVRYGFNNSAGRTDTVWAACAAAGSGRSNYLRQMRHPAPGSIQNQAVCRWLSRWVRRRRRDDDCDSSAGRK